MANNYLIIVESPAKSKTIKKFLGNNYKIAASMGHIRDLPKSQLAVDIENDFEPKYINIRGKADLIKSLKKDAKNAKKVFLATDPDREGEAISWHLAYLLDIPKENLVRITFNEITESAVKKAIAEPRDINMNLVDAQQARRVLDRLVGYQISPLLWKNVKKGLSAGRVQSVALKLIVDRENEIEKFIPEEYWSLTANLFHDKKSFEAKLHGTKDGKIEISSQEEMNKILKDLEKAKYIVSDVKQSEKKRNPSAPFTTSTLQQEASRKLGFGTSKTMMIAQQLYEGLEISGHGTVGLITYMRTDSTRVSDEAKVEARKVITEKYGKNFLPETPRVYATKKNSQDAHEAIRPSYISITPDDAKSSLTPEQFKLYKLIWERFIASQMESAVYDTLSIDISANEYIFRATGSQIKFPGFMTLYIEGEENKEENNNMNLPTLEKDTKLDCKQLSPEQHFTEPPARFSEASLVKTLEENGIGRPSTYAPTITTIIARGYVEREKKILYPTELGTIVNNLLVEHFSSVINETFTADMESNLDSIAEGNSKWKEVIRDFYGPFEEVLKLAEEKIGKVELTYEESDVECEKCGRKMVIKQGKYGKFLACPGFPECRNAKPIVEEAGVNCPICNGKILVKKTKRGKKYFACENSAECNYMIWEVPTDKICEKCGSFLCKKGKGLVCGNPKCNPEILQAQTTKKKTTTRKTTTKRKTKKK
ncbi:MAG: type I DNA topoisomerase [Clostridiales bacterium]|nr:type I DNA topoisomerase [Clostridiales bacterium]